MSGAVPKNNRGKHLQRLGVVLYDHYVERRSEASEERESSKAAVKELRVGQRLRRETPADVRG